MVRPAERIASQASQAASTSSGHHLKPGPSTWSALPCIRPCAPLHSLPAGTRPSKCPHGLLRQSLATAPHPGATPPGSVSAACRHRDRPEGLPDPGAQHQRLAPEGPGPSGRAGVPGAGWPVWHPHWAGGPAACGWRGGCGGQQPCLCCPVHGRLIGSGAGVRRGLTLLAALLNAAGGLSLRTSALLKVLEAESRP